MVSACWIVAVHHSCVKYMHNHHQVVACRDAKGKSKASVDQGLHLPDVDTVLPLQTALQGLASQHPAAVKAVYLHWCQKRQFSERPLLQRLWYEPPWHRLTVAGAKKRSVIAFWKCAD